MVKGEEEVYTYFSDKGHLRSRIDYVLVSENVKAEQYKQTPLSFSDHQAVVVEIRCAHGVKFGRGGVEAERCLA